jgi:ubiquinone/menaquinone biosynthesis C-methylase UbiE
VQKNLTSIHFDPVEGLSATPEVDTSCSHLPEMRSKRFFCQLRAKAVYHIWKRKIGRYGRLSTHSHFKLLDVGCGPGNFICCLEDWFRNSDINGLDVDPELLGYTAGRTRAANLLQGNAEEIPFEDEAFHILSGFQLIEHVSNPERFLSEAYRVLKKGGLLLLATPNPRGLAARLLGERWKGIRYDHISLRTPEQWNQVIIDVGFNILESGTTLFNGIPIMSQFPLALPFQLLQAIFGWFPWQQGSSYMVVARKVGATATNLNDGEV